MPENAEGYLIVNVVERCPRCKRKVALVYDTDDELVFCDACWAVLNDGDGSDG